MSNIYNRPHSRQCTCRVCNTQRAEEQREINKAIALGRDYGMSPRNLTARYEDNYREFIARQAEEAIRLSQQSFAQNYITMPYAQNISHDAFQGVRTIAYRDEEERQERLANYQAQSRGWRGGERYFRYSLNELMQKMYVDHRKKKVEEDIADILEQII